MDSALELEKLRVALQVGADTVMDLSTGGPLTEIRRSILAACPVPVGTVPLDQVQANMQLQKRLCHGASFYVLGPLVTDVAKGVPGARDWDDAMSRARADLDWDKQIELAMDPARARHHREQSHSENGEVCTMCGDLCAYKTYRDARGE